jgi:hypothetical protein
MSRSLVFVSGTVVAVEGRSVRETFPSGAYVKMSVHVPNVGRLAVLMTPSDARALLLDLEHELAAAVPEGDTMAEALRRQGEGLAGYVDAMKGKR